MRRIALLISVVLSVLSCSGGDGGSRVVEGDISIAYLHSLADGRSQRLSGDMWIEGCVVLNDKLDECYKSFVLYDGTAGIDVKIDLDDVDRVVPLYAGVRIRCEGLYVGREGERYVLGAKPTAEYVVDRIAEAEVLNRMTINTAGDSRLPARKMGVAEIGYDDVMCYVRVDGVQLVAEERGLAWCDVNAEDMPFESSLRHFTDGCDTLTVATIIRFYYANDPLMEDVVTLMGVVDSYLSDLVMRLSDCKIFIPATN